MFPIPVQRDFSLRHLNTFGIDAKAAAYLPVDSVDTLLAVKTDKELSKLKGQMDALQSELERKSNGEQSEKEGAQVREAKQK